VKVRPLRDVIIIRRASPDQVSSGGILLNWSEDYKEDIGEVMFVGPGRRYQCSKCKALQVEPTTVKPGDLVLFSTNGHQITKINGEELVVLREGSIICKMDSKQAIESGTRREERKYMGRADA
jgi:chaperonin GroES